MHASQPKCFVLELSNLFLNGIKYLWIPIFSMVWLGGCTNLQGLHLHNSADEELARKASDSFKSADVGAFIESQRKTLAAVNERDLAVTRRNVMAERDAAIITALGEKRTTKSLLDLINTRLARIGIPSDPSMLKVLHALEDELEQAIVSRDIYLVSISTRKLSPPLFPPTTEDEKAIKNLNDPTIELLFNDYKNRATQYLGHLKDLESQTQGLIGELNQKILDGRILKGDLGTIITDKRKALEQSVNDYKNQVKDSTKDVQALRSKIEEALKSFDEVVKPIQAKAKRVGLEDLLLETHLEKLKVAREQLGLFLHALAQEDSAEAQAANGNARSKADMAGDVAAILVNATKEIQDSSTRVKLVPLIFEQERLKLEIDRVQRAVNRGKQKLDLLEKQRAVLIAEGLKLIAAKNSLTKASISNPTSDVNSLLTASNTKGYVIHALLVWAESIAVDKLRQEEIEITLISLDHEQALDASEYALNLWKHVIASPLQELVGYHSSGLTSEDIANLIHAAGLAGIAIGVNR